MKKLLCAIILFLAGRSMSGQEAIVVDDALQCPYYISVETGGQFDLFCPSTGYIIVWAGVTYPSKISYSINNGTTWSSGYEFYNLAQGNYYVRIKVEIDGQECEVDYPYNPVKVTYKDYMTQYWDPNTGQMITTGKSVIDTVTVTSPANCSQTGSLFVDLIENTNSFEFSLDGINFQSSPAFNNLSVGRYRVFVRRIGTTCVIEYRHQVVIYPKNLIKSFDYTFSRSCSGYNLNLIATPAIGVEYSIDNGVTWQTSGLFVNVPSGYYRMLCRKNGCIYTPDNNLLTPTPIKPQIFDVNYSPGECGSPGTLSFILAHQKDKENYLTYEASTDNENYTTLPDILDPVTMPVNQGVNRIYLKVKWYDPATDTYQSCTYFFDIPLTLGTLDDPIIESEDPQCNLTNGSITILPYNNHYLYSIDGGNTWSSTNSFTGLGPDTYEIAVKTVDELCFSDTLSVVLVNQNTPPAINEVTIGQLSDCGFEDGTIAIGYSSGTGNTLFSIDNGNNWSSNQLFSGLAPGSYFIVIKNENNSCPVEYDDNPAVIMALIPPQITEVLAQDISDCGAVDGIITFNATAGSSPVQYSIDNGLTWHDNAVFTDLPNGEYQAWARNNTGTCKVEWADNPIIISGPQPPVIDAINSTDVSDCNVADGMINISAQQGSASAEYSIDNGQTWSSENVFTGLAAGEYAIQVRNSDGTCKVLWADNPVVILAPAPPIIQQVSFTNTTDCGLEDGTITISFTPGTGNTLFSKDNGGTWQTSNIFVSLPPGPYNLKVKNSNGTCVTDWAENPLYLTGHTAPAIQSVQSTDVTDCGLMDGTITIAATAGEGSILYSINDGSTWSTNPYFSSLGSGNYLISIKNNNGTCEVDYPGNPTVVGSPLAPSFISVESVDVSDCNANDGKIIIVAQQGSEATLFSIDNGVSWSSSSTFIGLPPDTYFLKIKNQNNTCIESYEQNPVNLQSPTPPQITMVTSSDATDCDAEDGMIVIIAIPGSSPVRYSIDNGASWQNNGSFSNLDQGTYYAAVSNDDGTCIMYYGNPIVLTAPSAPSILSVVVDQPTDCMDEYGSITIGYTTGSGSPQFTVDGGQNWQDSPIFTDLPPGTYITGIRNADGSCTSITTTPSFIEAITPPEIEEVSVYGLVGCTSGLASIYIDAAGSPGRVLEYSIDNGNSWQLNAIFSNLGAGEYHIKTRYNTSICEVDYSLNPITITPIPPPEYISVEVNQPASCNNPATGSIIINAADENNLPLQYSINNGQSWFNHSNFTNTGPGTYFLLVRNSLGCVSGWAANPIILAAPMQPSITAIQVLRNPDCSISNGSIEITYEAVSDVELSIDDGLHWQSDPLFTDLPGGSYIVRIRNADGNCQNGFTQNPFVLSENIGFFIADVSVTQPSKCDISDGKIQVTMNPQEGDYEYSLDKGQSWQDSSLFSGLMSGPYTIRVKRAGTDCQIDFPDQIVLQAMGAPNIDNVLISQLGCTAPTGTIRIVTDFPEARYSIDGGQTWQDSAMFVGLPEGLYTPAVSNKDGSCVTIFSEGIELKYTAPFHIQHVRIMDQTDCIAPNGTIRVTTDQDGLLYSIDGGNTWSGENEFGGLVAGEYLLVVKDPQSGCIVNYPVLLIVGSDTDLSIMSVDFLSTANCDGLPAYIEIESTGTDIQFSIDDGLTWSVTGRFDSVPSGTYVIAVRNSQCLIYGDTLVFEPLQQLTMQDILARLPSACGRDDGMLNLICPEAAEFSIDGGQTFTSTNDFDSLKPGIYYPALMSGQQCTFFTDPIALYPDASDILDTVTAILPEDCISASGSIHIYPSQHNQALEYSIDLGETWQPIDLFTGLKSGKYYILVRDSSQQCILMWPEKVIIHGLHLPVIDSIDIAFIRPCEDGYGKITIHALGSNNLYTIDGGQHWYNAFDFSPLKDGDYVIMVKDSVSECVTEPLPVRLSNAVPDLAVNAKIMDVSDCDLNDGSIVLQDYPDIETSIDMGLTWQKNGRYYGLTPGRYNILSRNSKSGCLGQQQVFYIGWPQFDPDSITLHQWDAYCGQPTGSIVVEMAKPLEYSIDQGLTWTTNTTFTSLTPGYYELKIREGAKCLFDPGFPIDLLNQDSLKILTNVEAPTCKGMDNGKITLAFPPGTAPKVVWADGKEGFVMQGPKGTYRAEVSFGTCYMDTVVEIPASTTENIPWQPVLDTVVCNVRDIEYNLDTSFEYRWYVNRILWDSSSAVRIPTPSDIRLVIEDARGCVTSDGWQIARAKDLYDFDFLLPGEGLIHFPVIAVDISKPIPDKIIWIAESSEKETDKVMANQYHVIFGSPGIYTVEAHFIAGDCEEVVKKKVRIFSTRDSLQFPLTGIAGKVIASMRITPNPNNGSFRLITEYFDIQPGNVFVYNAAGKQVYSQRLTPQYALEETPIALTVFRPGVYSLIYLADTGEFHWINFIIIQ